MNSTFLKTIRKKGALQQGSFPKLDLDDFYDFECAVFGALLPWQLPPLPTAGAPDILTTLLTAGQPPHDAADLARTATELARRIASPSRESTCS
jgi:hypothetical protein